MKNRYFIDISYSGKSYCGWQRQPNGLSVQEVIEKCIGLKTRQEIEIVAAGRTDAGVHAKCMTAHFDYHGEWNDDLTYKINAFLPADVSIFNIRKVKNDSHARFSANYRAYEYHFTFKKDPFLIDFAWYISKIPDLKKMELAIGYLFHYNEFTSFSKLHSDNKTDICKILEANLYYIDEYHLVFKIKADRFLRNMVRAISSTLIDVGNGKLSTDDFKRIIEEKNRSKASMSAPANGLFFLNAGYEDSIYIK